MQFYVRGRLQDISYRFVTINSWNTLSVTKVLQHSLVKFKTERFEGVENSGFYITVQNGTKKVVR